MSSPPRAEIVFARNFFAAGGELAPTSAVPELPTTPERVELLAAPKFPFRCLTALQSPVMALGLQTASSLLVVFFLVLAADIMGLFSRKNHFQVDGRVIHLF